MVQIINKSPGTPPDLDVEYSGEGCRNLYLKSNPGHTYDLANLGNTAMI